LRSSADTFDVTLMGAEKPRLSDSTGRSGTPVNSKVCARLRQRQTPRTTGRPSSSDSDMSRPSPPTSRCERDHHRLLDRLPGVGGTVCVSSSR
jgi:hypothetical protein